MTDLISIDEYKIFARITSGTQDDQLEPLITSVSDLIKTYCNSSIIDNTGSPGATETFDIQWNTHVVQLSDSPIIDIISVEERSSQGDDYTVLVNDGTDGKYEYYFDSLTDSVMRTNESGTYKTWCWGAGSVRVTYTSGYLQTPEDLKLAAYNLVTYYNKAEWKEDYTLAGASVSNPGTSTIKGTAAWPDHIRRVLDLYKVA